jgi:tRNA threonylcarbamoyladenosine biosynthesis protein TsaB
MTILGIDTATPTASVALIEDQKLLAEQICGPARRASDKSSPQPKGNHAEVILPLIRSILGGANLSLSEISGIAVSIGPGSFTGLRIALATVKGIAYEWGLPVVGVSTLHANAARVDGGDGFVCSLLDARKQEVYAALFRRAGKALTRVSEDAVLSVSRVSELLSHCGAANPFLVGDGARAYETQLKDSFGGAMRFSAGDEFGSVAAQVAILARERFLTVATDNIGALSPVYLRRCEAESKRFLAALTS